MSTHGEDPDLRALRSFRTHDAEPPSGLQARIEELLLQDVLAEEARIRGGVRTRTGRGGWLASILRPATAIGLAVSIAAVLAVATSGGNVIGTAAAPASDGGPEQEASLLDATAAALFGGESAAAMAPRDATATAGDIELQRIPFDAAAQGVAEDGGGAAATRLPRDPDELRTLLQRSAAEATASAGGDPTDRMAFTIGMSWVVDPTRPADLRASFVRAIGGLEGVERVIPGTDLFGRQGLVIGHVDAISGMRDQFVLDAAGGDLLERRSFTTSYLDAACPPGTFTAYEAFDDGVVIEPEQAQWAAWPSVIDACDPGIVAQ